MIVDYWGKIRLKYYQQYLFDMTAMVQGVCSDAGVFFGASADSAEQFDSFEQGDSTTVLVVDDHDAIRELLRTYLEIGGHRVLVASSGKEAREVAARHRGEISHMVVDLILPGENGGEIAKSLAAAHPQAAILFISGMDEGAAIEAGHIEPGTNFLKKPFGAGKLEAALDEARLRLFHADRTQ